MRGVVAKLVHCRKRNYLLGNRNYLLGKSDYLLGATSFYRWPLTAADD
jgi:hypothetical protein